MHVDDSGGTGRSSRVDPHGPWSSKGTSSWPRESGGGSVASVLPAGSEVSGAREVYESWWLYSTRGRRADEWSSSQGTRQVQYALYGADTDGHSDFDTEDRMALQDARGRKLLI